MALFDNFPYTNIHELNLDWVLRKMRQLIAEWAKFHADIVTWRADITKEMSDLRLFVLNYFDALDLDAIVSEKINDLLESGTFAAMVEAALDKIPHDVKGDLVLNTYKFTRDSSGELATGGLWMQGGCFIGDNQLVVYFNDDDSDLGSLTCYDINTHATLWSVNITGYHGAAMAYDGTYLYLLPMFSYADPNALFSYLIRIDPTNPAEITPDQHVPLGFYPYSFTYDAGYFYFNIHGQGKANYDNLVYVCTIGADKAVNIVRQMRLEGYGDHAYSRTQGLQGAAFGNLYELLLDVQTINVYSAETGERLNSLEMEHIINNYRLIGEMEFLALNPADDEFYLGSTFVNNGFSRWRTGSICKVGLHHSIEPAYLYPANWGVRDPQGGSNLYVNVVADAHAQADTRPGWMSTPIDAINLAKTLNVALRIRIFWSSDSETATPYEHFYAVDLQINNFRGHLEGQNQALKTPAVGFVIQNSNITLQNFSFDHVGHYTTLYGTEDCSGVFIDSVVNLTLNDQTLEDTELHFYWCQVYDVNDTGSLRLHLTNSELNLQQTDYTAQALVLVSSRTSQVHGAVLIPEAAYNVADVIPIKVNNMRAEFMVSNNSTLKAFWVYNNVHYPMTCGYDPDTRDLVLTCSAAGHTLDIRLADKGAINDYANTLTVRSISYDGAAAASTRIYARM